MRERKRCGICQVFLTPQNPRRLECPECGTVYIREQPILDKLIIELDEKHNFGMDEYWRSMHELKIKFKTPEDRSRFEGHLRNDGAFRKSSKYHKEWTFMYLYRMTT